MEIKNNRYTSFCARRIIVSDSIANLGVKTLRAFKEALPDLFKLVDDKTDIFVSQGGKVIGHSPDTGKAIYGDTKYLFIKTGKVFELPKKEPKTGLGKWFHQTFLKKEPETRVSWDLPVAEKKPEDKNSILSLAKSAIGNKYDSEVRALYHADANKISKGNISYSLNQLSREEIESKKLLADIQKRIILEDLCKETELDIASLIEA